MSMLLIRTPCNVRGVFGAASAQDVGPRPTDRPWVELSCVSYATFG